MNFKKYPNLSKPTFETLLIREVKNRPFLWDVCHVDYHNKPIKKEAWDEIATLLKVAESDCYKRWRSLRDRYVATLKNRHSSCKVGRKWKYMDDLMFLKDITLGIRSGMGKKPKYKSESVTNDSQEDTMLYEDRDETHFTFVDPKETDDEEDDVEYEPTSNVSTIVKGRRNSLSMHERSQESDYEKSIDPFLPVIGEFFDKVPVSRRMSFKMDVLNYIFKKFDELKTLEV